MMIIVRSDCMATRMQKYYEDVEQVHSRTEKNKELYKEIAKSEINKFELSSNATVLSDAKNNIDIEKIKKILDTKYNEVPKRRSIRLDKEEDKKITNIEDTKEYDINAILEKAKEEKETNYEQDRLKKLRDTQFNILNQLNLEDGKKEDEEKPSQDDLMELINTITAKELENQKKGDLDPLDILTDLKGEGEVTSPIERDVVGDNIDDSYKKNDDVESKTSVDIDKSFFTTTSSFTESDFDDFNDLKAEVNSHKTIITIVVVVLMIIIVGAVVIGLNYFLDLGLF